MINKAVYGVIAGVVLVLGTATYFLATNLIETRSKLETSEQALAALATQVSEVMTKQENYLVTSNEITSEFRRQERDLQSLKNREEIVLAKRSLVQLRINKAFTRDQLALACLTGDTTACEQQ